MYSILPRVFLHQKYIEMEEKLSHDITVIAEL